MTPRPNPSWFAVAAGCYGILAPACNESTDRTDVPVPRDATVLSSGGAKGDARAPTQSPSPFDAGTGSNGPYGDGGAPSQSADAADARDGSEWDDSGLRPEDAGRLPDAATDSESFYDGGAADASDSVATFSQVMSAPLCVLVGPRGYRAPGQENASFYGTDLGFTYVHDGRLEILFGDTWTDGYGATIDPAVPNDDASGFIDLTTFPTGRAAARACQEGTGPFVRFDMRQGDVLAGTDPGFPMDALKTPVTAFSNGTDQFALFFLARPQGCASDDDCGPDLSCDPSLGFMFEEYFDPVGHTAVCSDAASACIDDTMVDGDGRVVRNSGFCVDSKSSVADEEAAGRIASIAIRMRVAVRDEVDRSVYRGSKDWLTNRFSNPTASTVDRFVPTAPESSNYAPADGVDIATERVFIWGRPKFAGVSARDRDAALYFAYADMPQAARNDAFAWKPRYFTHIDAASGRPHFSEHERDAAPLDLSGGEGDPHEVRDLVQQMTIRWVAALQRWVMLYGGGASPLQPNDIRCPIIETLIGPICDPEIRYGNGAVAMRTARHPWGPWSKPIDVLNPGDPKGPPAAGSLYGPGGSLYHPQCSGATCAPRTPFYPATEYGVLYGVNLIESWTEDRGDAVELYWNVSTWNPYSVSLIRTTLSR